MVYCSSVVRVRGRVGLLPHFMPVFLDLLDQRQVACGLEQPMETNGFKVCC